MLCIDITPKVLVHTVHLSINGFIKPLQEAKNSRLAMATFTNLTQTHAFLVAPKSMISFCRLLTKAHDVPAFTCNMKLLKMSRPGREGYAKVTFLNSTLPSIAPSEPNCRHVKGTGCKHNSVTPDVTSHLPVICRSLGIYRSV
jgi:hypothetical protein